MTVIQNDGKITSSATIDGGRINIEELKAQVRKETAKSIIGELKGDMAIATFIFNPTLASELKTICLRLEKEYGVES